MKSAIPISLNHCGTPVFGHREKIMTRPTAATYKSPLHQMTQTTPTCLWNDSASDRRTQILDRTRRGRSHMQSGHRARCTEKRIATLEATHSSLDQRTSHRHGRPDRVALGPRNFRASCPRAQPIFEQHNGKNGRLSIQTDPRLFRDSHGNL